MVDSLVAVSYAGRGKPIALKQQGILIRGVSRRPRSVSYEFDPDCETLCCADFRPQ